MSSHLARACGLGLSLVTSTAGAETLNVHWEAPDGCPPASSIRSEIEQLSGHEYPAAEHADLDAQGVVSAQPDGTWKAEIRIQTPQGPSTRQISGPTCEAVSHAAASIIALAVEPPPDEPPKVVSKLTVADSRPPAVRPVADRPVEAPKPPAPMPLGWHALGSIGFDANVLSNPTVLFRALAGLGIDDAVDADLSFAWFVPRDPGLDTSGSVSLWIAGASGCWRYRLDSERRLGPCLGFELGRRAVETTKPIAARAARVWAAPSLAARFEQRLSGMWWVPGELEVTVPLRRERFTLDGVGVVNQAPAVTFRALVGVEARVP